MKKGITIGLLFTLLLSCCACGNQASTAAPEEPSGVPTWAEILAQEEAEANAGQLSPEELYGTVDQTTPVGGVYKLWNAEGVKLIPEHPDAKFELLCNIDMGGATLAPIGTEGKPFTGEISGLNCTISNFTLEANDEGYLGFIGVNSGKIHDIALHDVTFVSKESTRFIGGIAAVSSTDIAHCTVKGTMAISAAAEDAVCGAIVGSIVGNVLNSVSDVDITYTAAGAAAIGGVAGTCENGRIEFTEIYGDMVVSGTNKVTGLTAGKAKTMTLQNVSFLGERNTLDEKLLTQHLGSQEEVTFEKLLTRDNSAKPLTEDQQKLRDRVVEEMYKMGSVEWSTSQNLYHDCTCLLTVCHGNYRPGRLHVGIPYNHKGGSYSRFLYTLDEDNVVEDWVYGQNAFDGFDGYIGNDCSTAVAQAWWTVSNSTDFIRCSYQHPHSNRGCLPVGDWNWEIGQDLKTGKLTYTGSYTEAYIRATGEQEMYECYAQMRKGDAYYSVTKDGGHTRMAAEDAVVVRDENGLIDPNYSYVLSHEQGAPAVTEPYFHTWRLNYKYTFANLYQSWKVPVTCEELLTGEMEPVECVMNGGLDGKLGMTTGSIKTNYFLDNVKLVIKDSKGNVAFDHTMWATVDRFNDANSNDNGIRNYNDAFNMGAFANALQMVQLEVGESYSYTVTVNLATYDSIVVKEGSFINGQA